MFPKIWKHVEFIPVPKSYTPTISELRPIALTSYFAKTAESYIAKWLWDDISDKIDPYQFGNRQNLSTCHYLVGLLHELYKNADKHKSISTIILIDFSKAF